MFCAYKLYQAFFYRCKCSEIYRQGVGSSMIFKWSTYLLLFSLALFSFNVAVAHEHKNTHASLTRAAFRYLDNDFLRNGPGNLSYDEIEEELALGVVDEDECLEFDTTNSGRSWGKNQNWNSHFYEAKKGTKLSINVGAYLSDGCEKIDTDFTNAAVRADMLWEFALEDFRAGKRKSAYRILGRVLHLVQDMTSPSHAHDNPHGQARPECGNDSDDFEQWGYCEGKFNHISDYFKNGIPLSECSVDIDGDGVIEHFGTPPKGIKCRLWVGLQRMYNGEPQGGINSNYPVKRAPIQQNTAHFYVAKVSNVTYDFTTFAVKLKDNTVFTDVQPDSELKRMLRGSASSDCGAFNKDYGLCEFINGFGISGEFQDIGYSEGNCGSVEVALPDTREEWYLMETGCNPPNQPLYPDVRSGFAFIENVGGEGPKGLGTLDSFIPLRYGCNADTAGVCKGTAKRHPRNKVLYQDLYGTHLNKKDPFNPESGKKTMLRIYGDVLYATAVAYGAGIIEEFVVEATQPPVADAGGPYEEEACQIVTLDGSGSSDPNGTVEFYEWDFTDDGAFDIVNAEATYEHAYNDVFVGQVRLRVTDDEGFTGEDTADVTITPDVTPPVLEEINSSPVYLWPPNHKMTPVAVTVETTDACPQDVVCKITEVMSNQPVKSRNDHTSPDWVITGDLTVDLRAERINVVPNGNGNGNNGNGIGNRSSSGIQAREYDLTLSCTDVAGNEANGHFIIPVNRSAAENHAADAPAVVESEASQISVNVVVNEVSDKSAASALNLLSLLMFLVPLARRNMKWKETNN